MVHYFNAALSKALKNIRTFRTLKGCFEIITCSYVHELAAAQNMWSNSIIKRVNNGHTTRLRLYIYMYISICILKKWQHFITKVTIKLAGNIYRNNLKNPVTLVMGELLFSSLRFSFFAPLWFHLKSEDKLII